MLVGTWFSGVSSLEAHPGACFVYNGGGGPTQLFSRHFYLVWKEAKPGLSFQNSDFNILGGVEISLIFLRLVDPPRGYGFTNLCRRCYVYWVTNFSAEWRRKLIFIAMKNKKVTQLCSRYEERNRYHVHLAITKVRFLAEEFLEEDSHRILTCKLNTQYIEVF